MVTISLGTATGPGSGSTNAAGLLHGADTGLYAAKSQGRNRSCVGAT